MVKIFPDPCSHLVLVFDEPDQLLCVGIGRHLSSEPEPFVLKRDSSFRENCSYSPYVFLHPVGATAATLKVHKVASHLASDHLAMMELYKQEISDK